MKKAPALILIGLITLSACGQQTENTPTPPDEKVNTDSTLNRSTSDTPAGQADAEDLKPGTDGNTNPP